MTDYFKINHHSRRAWQDALVLSKTVETAMMWHRDCTEGDGDTAESCSARKQMLKLRVKNRWDWPIPSPTAAKLAQTSAVNKIRSHAPIDNIHDKLQHRGITAHLNMQHANCLPGDGDSTDSCGVRLQLNEFAHKMSEGGVR